MRSEDAHEYIVSNHAKSRASQRFGVRKEGAINWIRQKLRDSKYVSEVVDDEGKVRNMYACNGVILIVDDKSKVVVTIMQPPKKADISAKFSKFAAEEVTKMERSSTKELRGIERLRANIEIELGNTRMKLLRARSTPTKLALQARINALEMRLNELPEDEFEVKRSKTRAVATLASVL